MTAVALAQTPVWLVGAGGLLGGELLRLLEAHAGCALAGAVTRTPGAELHALHAHCTQEARTCTAGVAMGEIAAELAGSGEPVALLLALPHGEAARFLPGFLAEIERSAGATAAARLRIVDLSADFRMSDPQRYQRWYGASHPAPACLPDFVYGQPEWNAAAIRGATRVAAPGCFATALQLAVLPAAAAGILDPAAPWILHAVTGSSGSGVHAVPGTHHPHRHGNFWAYALDGHRHQGELEQALEARGLKPEIHFLPHSGPFARGIHLTAALPLASPHDTEAVRAIYAAAYVGRPFVEVLEEGVPDIRRVAGSNRACLAVHASGRNLTVLLTLDNLIKGGAGQALQCLNLMLGLPETQGLPRAGLGVC